jgi:thermophilic metalloprotease (M29)
VEASAETEEDFLLETLDTDEWARRIGELGIGCNPGIDRYMRNIYFDEKMDGTVHVALGTGFEYLGGTNESAIHWDIVKDLRSVGRIELDGTVASSGPRPGGGELASPQPRRAKSRLTSNTNQAVREQQEGELEGGTRRSTLEESGHATTPQRNRRSPSR